MQTNSIEEALVPQNKYQDLDRINEATKKTCQLA